MPFYKDVRIMPQFVLVCHIFSDGQKKRRYLSVPPKLLW
ncbi:hypothetical protein NEIFL0001_1545 [Neisseria flavescens SK114]|nr:hypothetical protein NEIFL0001_1545 [Neisseria flavescens SK114]